VTDDENGVLVWCDPPTDGRGDRGDIPHELIAFKLRKQPGRWAKVIGSVNPSKVSEIRSGAFAAYRPAGTFEAVSRRGSMWVRYVGNSAVSDGE
jgi:hypothetical protein